MRPLALPWRAVRLTAVFLPPLLLWAAFGEFGRTALTQAGGLLADNGPTALRQTAAVLVFTVLVTVTAVVSIGMLYALRGAVTVPDGAGRRHRDGFTDVLGRTLMPFVVLYVLWGSFVSDIGAFDQARVLEEVALTSVGRAEAAHPLGAVSDFRVAALAAVAALLLRVLLVRLHRRRGSTAAAVGAAFFETAFALYAISSLERVVRRLDHWAGERVIVRAVTDAVDAAVRAVPGLTEVLANWRTLEPLVSAGIALPLAWLAIAALVYGIDIESYPGSFAARRWEAARRRLSGATSVPSRLAAAAAADTWEKYGPVLHAVRFLAGAGVPMAASFVLCYGLAEYAAQWLWLAATALIGPQEQTWWYVAVGPLDIGREIVTAVLTTAVLAAAVQLVTGPDRGAGVTGAAGARPPTAAPRPAGRPAGRATPP